MTSEFYFHHHQGHPRWDSREYVADWAKSQDAKEKVGQEAFRFTRRRS
jgi:hypothetical protein